MDDIYYDIEREDDVHHWGIEVPHLDQRLQQATLMVRKEQKYTTDPKTYIRVPNFDPNRYITID
jgi:hypothetical protein